MNRFVLKLFLCRINLLFVTIFVSVCFSKAVFANECVGYFLQNDQILKTEDRLENNQFYVDRGLWKYNWYLGRYFKRQLNLLHLRFQLWIDLGAGNAKAQRDYLYSNPDRETQLWSVSYKKPKNAKLDRYLTNQSTRYLHGRYFEDMNFDNVRADLITDVFGPLTYTKDISQLLQKSLSLLKPGGVYAAILPLTDTSALRASMYRRDLPIDSNIVHLVTFVNANGHKLNPVVVLNKIKGVRILSLREKSTFLFDDPVIEIVFERTNEPIYVPPLELISFSDGNPPNRVFRWNDKFDFL